MSTILPKPNVSVTESAAGGNHDIAITAERDGKSRTWTGSATTSSDAVKGAVEKMLGDPRTGEYL